MDNSEQPIVPDPSAAPTAGTTPRLWTSTRFWIALALVLVVSFALFKLWKEQIEDRVIPKRWGVVHEGQIYRSGQLSESLVVRMLDGNEIDVVIDMTGREPDNPDHIAEEATAEQLGIEHVRYPLQGDGKGDPAMYEAALKRLAAAVQDGEPALVHCAAGADRTGGMIAVWRLLVDGWDRDAIVDEMGDYDWRTYDKHDLLPYLDENMPRFAAALQEAGAIDSVPDPLPKLTPAD